MKSLNLGEVYTQTSGWLVQAWALTKNHLSLVLFAEFAFFGFIALTLLYFSMRKKRKKSLNGGIGKENLKDLDVGITHIREEAQNLLMYLEALTGDRSHHGGGHATHNRVDTSSTEWKRKADHLELELGTIRQKLQQTQSELTQARQGVGGGQGTDPQLITQLNGLQTQSMKLQSENQRLQIEMQQRVNQISQLQVQLQSAKSTPSPATAGSGEDLKKANEKVKFLENQLQEYAIIEEDIANIRSLKAELEQYRTGKTPVPNTPQTPKAAPVIPASTVVPTPTQTPAPAPEPAAPPQNLTPEMNDGLDELLGAAEKSSESSSTSAKEKPTDNDDVENLLNELNQTAPAEEAKKPASNEPAASTTSDDPFLEFDKIMKNFDSNAPSQAAGAAAPATAGTPSPENPKSDTPQKPASGGVKIEGEPNKAIEEEFKKFVE